MNVVSKKFIFTSRSIIHIHKVDGHWHVMNNKTSIFKSRFKLVADLYRGVIVTRVNRSLRILSKVGMVKEDK